MEAREGLAQAIRRVSNGVRGVANGDTEDCVQEALARALKSGVSLEAEQWLRTVAKRVAIDQHRRKRDVPSGAPTDLENWMPSNEGNPEETFIRSERQRAVREALDTLPARYRRALEAYAEEDSPAAVAKRLGLSASATWTLLSRARSRLRLQLEQVGFVPALVLGSPRVRGILAGAGAAAVAAAVAVAPLRTVPKVAEAPQPKISHVAAVPDKLVKVATAPVKASVVSDVPAVDVDEVTSQVAEVKKKVTTVGVGTCLPGAEEPLVVGLEVVEEKPNALTTLVDKLPPALKVPEAKTC